MTQERYQVNYQNFDQSYVAPRYRRSVLARIFGERTARIMKSPLVSSVSLFFVGAAVAGVMISSFSGSDAPDENLPVVQASVQNFKEAPMQRGGMTIPNSDSTVFMSMRADVEPESGKITLSPSESEMDLQEFVKEAEAKMDSQEVPANLLDPAPSKVGPAAGQEEAVEAKAEDAIKPVEKTAMALIDEKAMPPVKEVPKAKPKPEAAPQSEKTAEVKTQEKPKVENLLASNDSKAVQQGDMTVVYSEEVIPPKKEIQKTAASTGQKTVMSSKDTISFVRDILARKDAKAMREKNAPDSSVQVASAYTPPPAAPAPSVSQAEEASAAAVANIEPAAGFASGDARYYVQLSSIREQSRADEEWGKLQDKYATLVGQPHRVQKADLDSGTYFRIQAGPFTKAEASSHCESIKTQSSGNCFVVQ